MDAIKLLRSIPLFEGLADEDVGALALALERRTFKAAVDEDWKLSRQFGVTGVPTFVVGRYGVVGAQPYETLEQLVEKGAQEEAEEGD